MTSLKCSVTSCMHNSEHYCCKNVIRVEGEDETTTKHTCCCSFDHSKGDSFKNSYESPNSELKVECDAVNCMYNDNKLCSANHIDISGSGSKTSNDTACATFRVREYQM